eukprot:1707567-Amphidinium_carterae.3
MFQTKHIATLSNVHRRAILYMSEFDFLSPNLVRQAQISLDGPTVTRNRHHHSAMPAAQQGKVLADVAGDKPTQWCCKECKCRMCGAERPGPQGKGSRTTLESLVAKLGETTESDPDTAGQDLLARLMCPGCGRV